MFKFVAYFNNENSAFLVETLNTPNSVSTVNATFLL